MEGCGTRLGQAQRRSDIPEITSLNSEFLLTQHSFPVENVWAVRTACCSKTKRDLEQFGSRIDVTSKYCTKNVSILSDPLPVGKF